MFEMPFRVVSMMFCLSQLDTEGGRWWSDASLCVFQAFSVFFVCVAFTSDIICLLFIPVQWLFFAASTYVWVQYVWHTGKSSYHMFSLPSVFCYVSFECFSSLTSSLQLLGLWLMNVHDISVIDNLKPACPQCQSGLLHTCTSVVFLIIFVNKSFGLKTLWQPLPQFGCKTSIGEPHERIIPIPFMVYSLFITAVSLVISAWIVVGLFRWIIMTQLSSEFVLVSSERGVCLPTVSLWILFVYIEAAIRFKDLKHFHVDLCRPFAAHWYVIFHQFLLHLSSEPFQKVCVFITVSAEMWWFHCCSELCRADWVYIFSCHDHQ